MTRCDRCPGELVAAVRPKAVEAGGRLAVVRGVPMLECDRCGETYLDEAVASSLDGLLTTLLAGGAEIAIATYPADDDPSGQRPDRTRNILETQGEP